MTWNKFTSQFLQETKSRLQQTLYSTNQWLLGPAIRVRSLIAPIQLILAAKSTLVGKISQYVTILCTHSQWVYYRQESNQERGNQSLPSSNYSYVHQKVVKDRKTKKRLLFRLLWTKVLPKPKNDGSIQPSNTLACVTDTDQIRFWILSKVRKGAEKNCKY